MGTDPDVAAGWASDLGKRVGGRVISPSDVDYEQAAAVWNGCFSRRPGLLVKCQSTGDVAATVSFVSERGLHLAVRGGGHSAAGFSTCDGGVVLDLSPMQGVEVDPARSVAWAQGGCTWALYDAATAAHGLASTGGLVSTTGIAGLTLGGGVGWLTRKYGLACDNLLGAEVVTATGSIVRTSDSEHADLLWGLRGGGGNFGVVTEFEFRLHPVQTVIGGLVLFPIDRAMEVSAFYRDWIGDVPDEFTTLLMLLTAPAEEFVPAGLQGRPAVAIVGCHCGTESSADTALAPLRRLGPAVDLFEPMPYPNLQSMFDADYPPGDRYYFKAGFLPALTDAAAHAITQHMAKAPSPRNEFDLHHMGGAVSGVRAGDTAFTDRSSPFLYSIIAVWREESQDSANQGWARRFANDLARFSGDRNYVNFLTDPGSRTDVQRLYGEERYSRLLALKRRYDPGNLFRLNQNIVP